MTTVMTIRVVPEGEYELDANDVARLVDELDKLERPRATTVADTLRDPPRVYEPTDEDVVELMRALDHLRNLRALPKDRDDIFGPTSLRGNLTTRFGSRKYLLDPQTGEQKFESAVWGPIHGIGDRLVDVRGGEWYVLHVEPDLDPIEVVVLPWKPVAERF